MKSGNLKFLEASGPLQACNGTALPLPFSLCHSLCCWVEARNDAFCDDKSDDSDNSTKKTVANEISFP